MSVQLLCTFCRRDSLNDTVDEILDHYDLAANRIYVLENVEDPKQFILTYNVRNDPRSSSVMMESTIAVHRKKQTNTIYTIKGHVFSPLFQEEDLLAPGRDMQRIVIQEIGQDRFRLIVASLFP